MTYLPECVEGGFSEVDDMSNQAGSPQDHQPLSAGDVAQILRRGLWVIILAPLAIAGTALAFSFLQTPLYKASATLMVGQQQGRARARQGSKNFKHLSHRRWK
jgi:uncharacterized protein involved in exopolysaccharide biosynthesis